MDALEADLKRRENIDELVLEWKCDAQDSQAVKNVLNMLQPSTNLKRLTIKHYGGTRISYLGEGEKFPFPRLKQLSLRNCPRLKGDIPDILPSLTKINVELHIDSLANLQHLALNVVQKLESLPQGGLPSNLGSLSIGGCNGLSSIPIEDWRFQRLTSLSQLDVYDNGSESIIHNLSKNQLLPTSLVYFSIFSFSNLKLLEGKGLQHLTSLQELSICYCPNLESLPEDALPSSLLLLIICECPKLEERYDYQKGKHLSKIAHIPTIQINGEYYDP
ncbi:hypothetical protein K1719_043883 [Acacia pycnantha]|nr:hypothetical protein K1719_043883 [Acacia pycnantha]